MKQLAIVNPFNAPVYHKEHVSSTMDISRDLASNGEPHGTVITVDYQETGRGRTKGRLWEMEKGSNLPFTILLRYPCLESIPAALTLRTGLAVALAVEDFIPFLAGRIVIKWPNDILIKCKGNDEMAHSALKAAGILVEAEDGNVHIGVGINISQNHFPPHLRDKATSISMAAGTAGITGSERFSLLEIILFRLHNEFGKTDSSGSDWKKNIEKRLYKNGEQVYFSDGMADSGTLVTGIIAGIGESGELLIVPNGESKVRSFITGELYL
ncbi:MAG: biotin--[acetyl-CoA-carboxylase] ligase [Treponema sp.]|nr:biotin--[acetyl-CoA-carboxylase] ligase [Treponema sp.]